MREAEKDKKLGGCVRGEAAYIILFDTRQEQERPKARRKKGYRANTSDKDADSDPTRTALARITCPLNSFFLTLLLGAKRYQS
jgi:hypothetical protein